MWGRMGWDEEGRYSRRVKTARYLARRPKWRSGVRRTASLFLSEERPEAKGRQFAPYFYRCMSGTNAPQSHSHKHTRKHSEMSHGWLLNTDNSCTCTSKPKHICKKSQRSGKDLSPSVCALESVAFSHLSNAWIKRVLWPRTKKEDNSNNNKKQTSIRLLSLILCTVIC